MAQSLRHGLKTPNNFAQLLADIAESHKNNSDVDQHWLLAAHIISGLRAGISEAGSAAEKLVALQNLDMIHDAIVLVERNTHMINSRQEQKAARLAARSDEEAELGMEAAWPTTRVEHPVLDTVVSVSHKTISNEKDAKIILDVKEWLAQQYGKLGTGLQPASGELSSDPQEKSFLSFADARDALLLVEAVKQSDQLTIEQTQRSGLKDSEKFALKSIDQAVRTTLARDNVSGRDFLITQSLTILYPAIAFIEKYFSSESTINSGLGDIAERIAANLANVRKSQSHSR